LPQEQEIFGRHFSEILRADRNRNLRTTTDSRLAETNGGHEAAGEGTFTAVTEKELDVAGGAEIARKNVLWAQARGEELRTIGFAEIEVNVFWRWLVAGRLHVEPLKRVRLFAGARFIEILGRIGKLCGEFGDKAGGNLVATGTDGRADGGEQMGGLTAEFELHTADGFLRDAGKGAPPTRMDGGNGALFRIDEENGHTVGGLNAEQEA